jgi:hypothetical protein
MSVNSGNFSEDFSKLSLEEKIETILSMLNTPIVRRKLGDYELSNAIAKTYYEFKEYQENDKT